MKRRTFLMQSGIATSLLGLASLSKGESASTPPNILFIMSDDHAINAIGAYGSRLADIAPTKNIDRLAREGMLLENCFCTNAICSPSRASILTGQYSAINGVKTLGGKVPPEKQTLPRLLTRSGYQTAVIGKWHLKTMPNFEYYKIFESQGAYFNPKFMEKNPSGDGWHWIGSQGHSSDLIVDSSLEWLKNRDPEKPFFLCNQFKAPHGKWENAPRFDKLFQNIDIPEPDTLWQEKPYRSKSTEGECVDYTCGLGTSISRRNTRRNMGKMLKVHKKKNLSDEEYTRLAYQKYLKRYLRCVAGVDENIGRLLNYLEKEGILDNTLIIYTADQGMFLGEHDYIDKRWIYEEALHMPFLARYPKQIPPNSRSDALVNNTDFAPTILDFAGLQAPESIQGRSFLPILEGDGEPADWRKASYYRYWLHMRHHDNPAHFGIRTKRYKLVFFYGSKSKGAGGDASITTAPGWELYDLKKDPKETKNVYQNPEYASVIPKLKRELQRQRKKYNLGDGEKRPKVQQIIDANWD